MSFIIEKFFSTSSNAYGTINKQTNYSNGGEQPLRAAGNGWVGNHIQIKILAKRKWELT